jgi:hypothetical protein
LKTDQKILPTIWFTLTVSEHTLSRENTCTVSCDRLIGIAQMNCLC